LYRARGGAGAICDYALRRNSHRLEKGLISRPRRDTFATDYIEETVEHLARGIQAAGGQIPADSELAWAYDVLGAYFEATGSAPEIDRARTRYLALRPTQDGRCRGELVPYTRDLIGGPPVSYDALLELAIRRRSVRWFDGRKVPREAIDAAIAVAAQSPSACNRQPFEFQVFDDPGRVAAVATAPGGAAGFTDGLPVVVAVVGDLAAFASPRDRHLVYIDGALAAMSFMLALETLGLSSCALNTPGEEVTEDRLAGVLHLASHERPVMLIAVGYPDPTGLVPRSQKKPLRQLRRYPA
jgi:nitroreductase